MSYRPFSIVAVPFPFAEKNGQKKRPALVISSTIFQEHHQHVTLAMITTAKNNHWLGDYEIQDLSVTGLTVKSTVRPKIFTIDSRLIIKSVGLLSDRDIKAVTKILGDVIVVDN